MIPSRDGGYEPCHPSARNREGRIPSYSSAYLTLHSATEQTHEHPFSFESDDGTRLLEQTDFLLSSDS